MIETQAAIVRRGVRHEQAGIAREGDEFATEVLRGAVRGLSSVGLQGDDPVADERPRATLEVLQFGGEGEVHGFGAFIVRVPAPTVMAGLDPAIYAAAMPR
jgi:hypothetical protein